MNRSYGWSLFLLGIIACGGSESAPETTTEELSTRCAAELSREAAIAKFPAGTKNGTLTLGRFELEPRVSRFEQAYGSMVTKWYSPSSAESDPITNFRVLVNTWDGHKQIPMRGDVELRLTDGEPTVNIVSDAVTLSDGGRGRVTAEIGFFNGGRHFHGYEYESEIGNNVWWTSSSDVEAEYRSLFGDGSGRTETDHVDSGHSDVWLTSCALRVRFPEYSGYSRVILNVSASF